MALGRGFAVALLAGVVPLGRWGVLRLDDTPVLADALLWLDDEQGILVVAPRTGGSLVRVHLAGDEASEIDWLVRDEDDDLRFMTVRPVPSGELLLLYERGLVCLEPDGLVRWHVLHDDLSADIQAVHD